ncbi:NAD-binding protein [bacterium]|nr:NAD-binding protein [bacterium]
MARIAILGLGAMGARMAANLLEAGHELAVWNRSPGRDAALVERGARRARSPKEAATGAEFVIAMLRDDDASREVWTDQAHGALAGTNHEAIAIESSTLSVGWSRALAARCAEAGIAFLDAPVAGSRPQAEAKALIHLVGGERETVERARPVLAAMGAALIHAGPAGSGAVLKLAVNMLFGVQVACVAEMLALMRRGGLAPEEAFTRLSATPVCSLAAKAAGEAILAGNFAPQFPVELVEKDFGYAVEALGGADAAPVAAAVRQVFSRAMEEDLGDQNLTAIAQLYGQDA